MDKLELLLHKNKEINKFNILNHKVDNRKVVFIICDDINNSLKNFNKDLIEELKGNILVFLNSMPHDEEGNDDNDVLEDITKNIEKQFLNIENKEDIEYIYVYEEVENTKIYHLKDLITVEKATYNEKKKIIVEENKFKNDKKLAYVCGDDIQNYDFKKTIIDFFLESVSQFSNSKYYFYDKNGFCEEFTYDEIFSLSKCMANALKEKGLKEGDKLIFQCNNNKDFIVLFWACTMSNIIVAPLTISQSFDYENSSNQIIKHVFNNLGKVHIAVSGDVFDEYINMTEKLEIPSSYIINIDELRKNHNTDFKICNPSEEDTEFIFFTSGSTGMPKGVVQSYKAVLAQVLGCIQMFNYKKRDVYLNWMPLEHPGGILMAHLRCVLLGSNQVIVNTNYILEEPVRWMDLIDKYRVNSTWAPHFAYVLIAESVEENINEYNWDLSCLTHMLNGGEMVNVAGVKKFLKTLAKFNLANDVIYPAWGMCETCSGSVYSMELGDGDKGIQYINKKQNGNIIEFESPDNKQALAITEIGVPIPGVSLRITDYNNNILPEDTIGRFQIKGVPITKGYYNNPQVNEESFTDDGWFITGDLGFVHNGKMAITGREKDIIVINGLNYNNVEIEAVIEKIPEVKTSYTGVCSVYDFEEQTDKIVVFFVPEDNTDYMEIRQKIINKVFNEIMLKIDIVIPLSIEEIPKTNLGKIQRTKLKKQYEAGVYDEFLKSIDIKLKNSKTIPEYIYTREYKKIPMLKNNSKDNLKTACIWGENKILSDVVSDIDIIYSDNFKYDKEENKVFVNKYNLDDYDKLVCILNMEGIKRVIYFDSFFSENQEFDTIKNRYFYPMVDFLKTLIEKNSSVCELMVLTNQVISYGDFISKNGNAGIFSGFVKCFDAECENINAAIIDLDEASLFMINNLNCSKSKEYLIRNGQIYTPILSKQCLKEIAARKNAIINGGLYLITGGLGGVGFEFSKYLISKYGAKVILIGRTEISKLQKDKLSNYRILSELSEDFMYYSCDCRDKERLQLIISESEKRANCKINGIFHAAGVGNLNEHWKDTKNRWIKSINKNLFEEMYCSKVYGTINLSEIVSNYKNCFLAIFSSTTSFWGTATFSSYSSANSFINEYALSKFNKNNNIFSLCFSSWKNLGMSKGNSFGDIGSKNGFVDILPSQGTVSIDLACRIGEPLIFIGLDKNGGKVKQYIDEINLENIKMKIFKSEIKENLSSNSMKSIANDSVKYFDNGLPCFTCNLDDNNNKKKEFNTKTEKSLLELWNNFVDINGIQPDSDFFEMGGNSILAVKLAKAIREKFKITYELRTIIKNSSFEKMVVTINDRIKIKE